MRARTVLETRASDSKEPSIRSLWRKRALEESPNVEEHATRNLVTFEVRTTPSSRLSTRVMEPGRTLFSNLRFVFQVSKVLGNVMFHVVYRKTERRELENKIQ